MHTAVPRRRAVLGALLVAAVAGSLLIRVPDAGADPVGSITGVVSTDGDATAVSDVQIELWDASESLVGSPIAPASDGSFTFSGLEPGDYTLHFPVEGAHTGWYVDQWYENSADETSATPVAVSTDPVTLDPIELALAPSAPKPTITGPNGSQALVGQELFATVGHWFPETTFQYQWLSDGKPLTGETRLNHKVTAADVTHAITFQVTASGGGTSGTTVSDAITPIAAQFDDVSEPGVVGTAAIGTRLSVTGLAWSPKPLVAYTWKSNGKVVSTASTYVVAASDAGHRLSVQIVGSLPGYTPVTETSASSRVVPLATLTPATPKITGKAAFGGTMNAVPGTWRPAGVHLSYQWYSGSAAIARAVKATYAPPASLVGHLVHVVVTGSLAGYTTAHASSTAHKIAAKKFASVPTPKISGSAKAGGVLTESVPASSTIHVQWRLGGKAIAGATKASYRVGSHDVGQRISVVITAARAGYTTVTHASAPTARIVGQTFANCTQLKAVYPYGVMLAGTKYNLVSGHQRALVGPPFASTYEYNLVIAHDADLDRDHDHIACEKS